MRAHAECQIGITRELVARVTKPHPEFACPQYVQNLQRTIRFLGDMLVAEIQSKADIVARLVEGDA